MDTFAAELRRLGHWVTVFAPRMGDYMDQDLGIIRVPSVRAPFSNLRRYFLMRPHLLREGRFLRALRPDVIHTHTPFTAGLMGDLLAKRLDIPLFTTYHTLLTEYCHYLPFPQDSLRWLAVEASRWMCNRCDGVIAPSHSIQTLLKTYGVSKPIRVIPTGIDLALYNTAERLGARRAFGLPDDAVVLLYVGRVAKEKNLPFLFEVYRRLFQQDSRLLALIVGGGPELNAMRQLAFEMGIGERTVFAGMVSKADTPRYYACGDIFTFASVTETQGLVIAEALASGLPVVLVDAMGVTDMVKDGRDGFLSALDPDEYGRLVERLTRDNEMRGRMGLAAREEALRFSATEMARRLVGFYEEILGQRPRRIIHRRRRVV